MAVSDYRIKDAFDGKISSDADEVTITLIKTPKIIAMLRKLAPKAIIVGFKLLFRVDATHLIERT